uniref:BUD13 homolog n=1 Tax=Caenorhabditis tropicalis TaxID=1561998 RepID=A0A1I7U6F5_9PELO
MLNNIKLPHYNPSSPTLLRKSTSQKYLTERKNTAKKEKKKEASPEDYGYYQDPLEHATGREKKMLLLADALKCKTRQLHDDRQGTKGWDCGHWFKEVDADPESI